MFDKLTRLSDDGFNDAVLTFQANARAVNSTLAMLIVQAILHYYEHSRDISRCKHLHAAIDEVGMGRQLTAFAHVLRATTPQTGIGTENWKGGKVDAEPPEGYESVLAKLVNEEGDGVGSQLMLFAAPAAKKKGDKKGKAKQLKLPDGTPEALVNSVQRVLDSKTPAEVAKILTAAEKGAGAPEFKDPDAEKIFRETLAIWHQLEDYADKEVSYVHREAGKDDEMRKTTGRTSLRRAIANARGFGNKVLGDFTSLQDDVKNAAIAANDEAA